MTITQFFNFFGICQVPNRSKFFRLSYEHGRMPTGTPMCGLVTSEYDYFTIYHLEFDQLKLAVLDGFLV